MQIIPAGVTVYPEVNFGIPALYAGMILLDLTTGSPVQVGSVIAGVDLGDGSYCFPMSSTLGHSYVVKKQVFTDGARTVVDQNYATGSEAFYADDSTATIKTKTDNLPADPASNTQVNTRLAASSYVAPDNADIVAIKAKTDNLPSDPASNTQVNTRATPADISAEQAALTALINAVAGNVWEQLIASHTTVGTFGLNAQNPPVSPTQIAQAVWNALLVDYIASGSFGANAQTPSLTAAQVTAAVLDVAMSAHQTPGTVGASIASGGAGGGSGIVAIVGDPLGAIIGVISDPKQSVLGVVP